MPTRTRPDVRIADVNIFIYARRRESDRHDEYREWIEDALIDAEPFGVSTQVLSSFVRIVTNPRVYVDPTPIDGALAFCDVILNAPSTVPITPGPRHWHIFEELCREGQARGNLVPDAYLAAMAVDLDATWFTTDRRFARFPQLRLRHPLSG